MGHVLRGKAFSLICILLYNLTPLNMPCSKQDQLKGLHVFHRTFMVHRTSFGLRGSVETW